MFENQTVCTQCRKDLRPEDWTCPRCGSITAPYLFGTIKLKSLQGNAREAYLGGYQDCRNQAEQTGSPAIRPESYHPAPANENAYRAGWKAAADKLDAKADRKFGRRRGLIVLGTGAGLLTAGIGIAFLSMAVTHGHITLLALSPIGLGALNILLGIVMIITGSNDEARPE